MLRIIAGGWRKKKIILPPPDITRPSSDRMREALFNILQHGYGIDFEDAKVIDFFAGSGSLGLEALSRGASFACFVENNPIVIKVLKENIFNMLHLGGDYNQDPSCVKQNVKVVKTIKDAKPFLPDIVFMDPPYEKGMVYGACDDLISLGFCKPTTLFVIETSERDVPKDILVKYGKLRLDRREQYGKAVVTFWRLP